MPVFVNVRRMPQGPMQELQAAFGPVIIDTPKTLLELRHDHALDEDSIIIRYNQGAFHIYFMSGLFNAFVHRSIASFLQSLSPSYRARLTTSAGGPPVQVT